MTSVLPCAEYNLRRQFGTRYAFEEPQASGRAIMLIAAHQRHSDILANMPRIGAHLSCLSVCWCATCSATCASARAGSSKLTRMLVLNYYFATRSKFPLPLAACMKPSIWLYARRYGAFIAKGETAQRACSPRTLEAQQQHEPQPLAVWGNQETQECSSLKIVTNFVVVVSLQ